METIEKTTDIKDILIVEDTMTQAMLIQHMLKKNGYTTAIARSAKAALESLEKTQPDLILSDVNMPEITGYELAAMLKKDARFANIPMVLLITPIEIDDIFHIVECGADDVILKSYPEPVFVRKLAAIGEQVSYRRKNPTGGGMVVRNAGKTINLQPDGTRSTDLLISCFEMVLHSGTPKTE